MWLLAKIKIPKLRRWIDNGKALYGEQRRSCGTPYQTYEEKVANTSLSDRGILLEDLRKTSFAGLFTKGGWRLGSGLIL